jgi:hypothetical protein
MRMKTNWILIKANISKKERNQIKAKAALKGITSQMLVGSLIRQFLNK